MYKKSILTTLRKPLAFVKVSFISATSYKLSFLMDFMGIFFSAAIFFFLGKLVSAGITKHLSRYGGDYFSFALVGIAFSSYLGIALNSLTGTIRNAQLMGTLEALLVTPTEIPTIVISSSLYNFLWTTVRVAAYIIIGYLFFGLDMSSANYGAGLLVLVLTIIAFASVGIISASFIMVLKQGDPITWLFTNLSWFLGGLYYPVSVLPSWLQKVAAFLPLTHALEGMRLALLKGYTVSQLSNTIIMLVIFSAVLLPIGLGSFGYAVKRAKIDGTLTQY